MGAQNKFKKNNTNYDFPPPNKFAWKENYKVTETSIAYCTVKIRICKYTSGKKSIKSGTMPKNLKGGGRLVSPGNVRYAEKKGKNLFGLVPWANR